MFTSLSEGFGNLDKKLNLFVAVSPMVYVQNEENAPTKYEIDTFPYL